MVGRRVSLLVAAGFCGAVLAGCASGNTSTGAMHADSANAGGGAAAPAQAPAPKATGPNEQQVSQPGVDRKLIRTANLDLAAPNVVEVTNRARDIAVALGGFAGQEDIHGDDATLTLHIPANQFDRALGQLSALVPSDKVRSRSETAEDVTEQLVDVQSRIATQRTSVQRVRDLLAKATSLADVVQIEGELTKREADLESLEKREQTLTGQVALSQVTVKVGKDTTPPLARQDSGGFLSALAGGWHAFLATGGVLLQVLGALLPFLVALGIPGVILARRWLRRRKPAVEPAGS